MKTYLHYLAHVIVEDWRENRSIYLFLIAVALSFVSMFGGLLTVPFFQWYSLLFIVIGVIGIIVLFGGGAKVIESYENYQKWKSDSSQLKVEE